MIGRDLEAEILRLYPGVSVRVIAHKLRVSRWTVHRVVDRFRVPKAPGSSLDAEEPPRSVRLDNGPWTRSPRVPT